jgi:hypothetical protein
MNSATNNPVDIIEFEQGGNTINGMITSNDPITGGKDPLSIILPGVITPLNPSATGSTYQWDANTNANQPAGSGMYYIKFEQIDQYGHTNVIIKEVQVIDNSQYAKIMIYNSAGELVWSQRVYKNISASQVKLNISEQGHCNGCNVVGVEKGATDIRIFWGSGLTDYVSWDGRNDQGLAVTPGTYEVQVGTVSSSGSSILASKTILLLDEGEKFITSVAIAPNPFNMRKSTTKAVKFVWVSSSTGFMDVAIYNFVGEKVKTLSAKLEDGSVSWNMYTADNSRLSDGNYVVIMHGRSSSGYTETKMLKMSVISTR